MTTTYESNIVLSSKEYDVLGTRPIRHDGHDKVTGKARYGADVYPTGLLYAKWLRSPHAHARIKSVDTTKAEALSGVQGVVTGKDLPETLVEPGVDRTVTLGELSTDLKYLREGILARDKVVFKGHPIAAVAAVSPHVAEEAVGLIEVEYELLPPVLTAPEAMKDDAPIIHEDLETEELGESTGKISNVAQHFQHKLGDVAKAFEEADIVIEREFNTSTVHQGYIEPHTCTADWNADGRVYIWNSCQGPFNIRDATAEVLDIPLGQVRLTPMEIGGGFGGKFEPYGEPVAALLSKKTGHPVKMVMTRSEDLECTGPTPGSFIRVKMGATRDGKIVAAQAHLAYEAGAAPGSPVSAGAEAVFAPYDIPNMLVDGYDVVVNKPKTAAYRAPGATNAEFASETVVDELAEKLGIDPLELRLKNAAKEGSRKADGVRYARIGCAEVIEAMMEHPHYTAPLAGPNRARGVAVGYWMNAGLQSAANITVNNDGTINLTEGSPDIGGTRASLAMQAAEVLGIRAEDVHPAVADTDSIGWTFGTGGSRTTFATGWAVYEAAQDVKRQMIERAAMIWGVDKDSLEMERGVIRSEARRQVTTQRTAGTDRYRSVLHHHEEPEEPELSMTFKELAEQLNATGGPIMGRGSVDPKGVGAAFAGLIVDIKVDPDTGKIDILRATVVQDAGKAIHPSYVEGQMQGGTAQGIGWGLNEEYFMDKEGRMANNTLLDYRMPIAMDLPMIDTVIVEVANPGHPFGVRGVGEVSIVPPPAAIANALHRALGIRIDRLPMNPGAVVKALWEQSK